MEGETLDMFYVRFKLILMSFQSKYFPTQFQLIGWFRHLVSFSYYNYQEQESISFVDSDTFAQNDNFDSSQM